MSEITYEIPYSGIKISNQNQDYEFDISSWWKNIIKDNVLKEYNETSFFNKYTYDNINIIKSFLVSNPSIKKYLIDAPIEINKYFKETELNIEVIIDPEIKNDNGTLFINIETSEELNSAMKKLDSLTKEWLIPNVGKDITKFNVDLDFT